jgi:nucleotide-binding universal stress UspA family protein
MALSSILAPIDFSEDSARGACIARDIARRHAARLTLLHVDGLPVYTDYVAEARSAQAWVEYLEQRDQELEQRLRAFAVGLQCEGEAQLALARGDAGKAILEHARENACDLVVLSPRGAGYGQPFLLGSVSAQVATESACPVLVTRLRSGPVSTSGTFMHPIVAISNTRLAENALRLTMAVAQAGTQIHLLHVLESCDVSMGPPLPGAFQELIRQRRKVLDEQLTRLAEPVAREGFATSVSVEAGDPSFNLLCRLERDTPGLVVVSRKMRADGRGVLSTPAYRMVKHSPVPVLVVPGETG